MVEDAGGGDTRAQIRCLLGPRRFSMIFALYATLVFALAIMVGTRKAGAPAVDVSIIKILYILVGGMLLGVLFALTCLPTRPSKPG